MQSLNKYLKLSAVYLFLHLFLSSYRLFPLIGNFNPLMIFLPMGELIIVFILILPGKFHKFRFVLSLIITSVLLFYNLGEIFYRHFYLENFHMIDDMQLIPGLFVMLVPGDLIPAGFIRIFSVFFSFTVILSLSALLLYPVLKLYRNFYSKNWTVFFLFSAALLILILAPAYSPLINVVKDLPSVRILSSEKNIGNYEGNKSEISVNTVSEEEVAVKTADQKKNYYTRGIDEADIHLVVVESYGAALFQKPEYQDHILDLYSYLEPLLIDDGWEIRSGYVRSPAFGGRSWLADASLLTASQINSQQMFDEIISGGEPAHLLKMLSDSGYYRYYIAPGTTKTSDEWKKAYPFDRYIIRKDFGYEGPNIAFGTLTDQFALTRFSETFLNSSLKEFAFYLLVSSHTPFERIPVFKEDWDFSLNGKEYESGYLNIFKNNWLTGKELAQGYLEGISYSLETTVRYLTEKLTQDEFMVVIGDHQPRKPISPPDPGYPVVFHIITPAKNRVQISAKWNLSSSLTPPVLPEDYDDIPEMAEIPLLIEKLISSDANSLKVR